MNTYIGQTWTLAFISGKKHGWIFVHRQYLFQKAIYFGWQRRYMCFWLNNDYWVHKLLNTLEACIIKLSHIAFYPKWILTFLSHFNSIQLVKEENFIHNRPKFENQGNHLRNITWYFQVLSREVPAKWYI